VDLSFLQPLTGSPSGAAAVPAPETIPTATIRPAAVRPAVNRLHSRIQFHWNRDHYCKWCERLQRHANDAGGAAGPANDHHAGGERREGGLTLQAKGGTGGNAWSTQAYSLADRHAPARRRRRVIFVSGVPASTA